MSIVSDSEMPNNYDYIENFELQLNNNDSKDNYNFNKKYLFKIFINFILFVFIHIIFGLFVGYFFILLLNFQLKYYHQILIMKDFVQFH